jgi:hypothetical protein
MQLDSRILDLTVIVERVLAGEELTSLKRMRC